MRSTLIIGALATALLLAFPAGATGGGQTFRVVTTGDAYMVALSSSCPADSYEPPGVNPGGSPLVNTGTCWLVKIQLGYDGTTGASSGATAAHVNHAFTCAVTASATGAAGNALPFPASMALSDSIVVGFDANGDSLADTSYGGRIKRPPIGAVTNRITEAANGADVDALLGTPSWYLSQFDLPGPTPTVSGNTDGATIIVWNQGGSDVTIDCSF